MCHQRYFQKIMSINLIDLLIYLIESDSTNFNLLVPTPPFNESKNLIPT